MPVYDLTMEKTLADAPGLSACPNNVVLINWEKLQPVFSIKLHGVCNKRHTLGVKWDPPDHLEVAQSLNNLAGLYSDQGKKQEGLEYIRGVVAITGARAVRTGGGQTGRLDGLYDAIADGFRTLDFKARMEEVEGEVFDLKNELKDAPTPAPVLHSNLAELYRRKVENLHQALSTSDTRTEGCGNVTNGYSARQR